MKYIVYLLIIVGILLLMTNRGVHRNLIEWAVAVEVLSKIEDKEEVELLAEYSTLPDYERAVILKYCERFYEDYRTLFGAVTSVPRDRKPGCQTLFRSEWSPTWTTDKEIFGQ